MKRIDDILKDKLEGYESGLPEGSLAEFRAKLDASRGESRTDNKAVAAPSRVSPLWLAIPALAVGLALILVPGHKVDREGIVNVVPSSAVAESVLPEANIDMFEECGTEEYAASRDIPSYEGENSENVESVGAPDFESKEPVSAEHPSADTVTAADKSSPIIPDNSVAQNERGRIKIGGGAVTAAAIGGTSAIALAALAPAFSSSQQISGASDCYPGYPPGTSSSGSVVQPTRVTHRMPFRMGLSLRIPVSDRWSLTTGADYSSYASTFEYPGSGSVKQVARYIGVPLRLDYTIVDKHWFEAYAGAGAAADFCIAASCAGARLDPDGVKFSLDAAGGLQFNVTDFLGLYIEPQLSWTLPSDHTAFLTRRSEHPLMFSVNSGIRFTIATLP